jgi:hypothetical protein
MPYDQINTCNQWTSIARLKTVNSVTINILSQIVQAAAIDSKKMANLTLFLTIALPTEL